MSCFYLLQLYQINDAWSRDYNSLTKKVEALTSGSWSTSNNGTSTHHLTNGTSVTHAPVTTAEQHQNARTPTHPPSFALSHASHSHACPNCFSLREQLDQLSRQAKELGRKNRDLEKLLEEEERKSKQKDMLIKSLDSENQAVQLQVNFYALCMGIPLLPYLSLSLSISRFLLSSWESVSCLVIMDYPIAWCELQSMNTFTGMHIEVHVPRTFHVQYNIVQAEQ